MLQEQTPFDLTEIFENSVNHLVATQNQLSEVIGVCTLPAINPDTYEENSVYPESFFILYDGTKLQLHRLSDASISFVTDVENSDDYVAEMYDHFENQLEELKSAGKYVDLQDAVLEFMSSYSFEDEFLLLSETAEV